MWGAIYRTVLKIKLKNAIPSLVVGALEPTQSFREGELMKGE